MPRVGVDALGLRSSDCRKLASARFGSSAGAAPLGRLGAGHHFRRTASGAGAAVHLFDFPAVGSYIRLHFPRQFMPAPMFWLSKALPTTYFVDLMRAIVIRGSGIIDVAADIGMILLIGVTILSVALLVFVKRLHRA